MTDIRNPPITAQAGDPRWTWLAMRDASADGRFWYSVRTTGVYCRPSCASRAANPKNIQFHDTIEDAEAAGFRPCRRCDPRGLTAGAANAAIVARICRLIESSEAELPLATLAAAAELSPGYFQRLFKSITGVSPKAYAAAGRADRLRDALTKTTTVTEAIYCAGYNSSGRFYETSSAILGMTPRRYRAGGAQEQLQVATGQCGLGIILVAASTKGIAAILIGDDVDRLTQDLQSRFPNAQLIAGNPGFDALVAKVLAFVDAPRIGLGLPLDIRGTAFQQRVWQALRDIPAGATATYADVAARIGAPAASRAVAGACAANKIAVAIPCHRVVRADGGLAGYRWGIDRKRALLAREGE